MISLRLFVAAVAVSLWLAPGGLFAATTAPGQAAIASAHPLASAAGEEILAAGGNAFDAAVAVAAALAVVEPYSSGLGGGGFFLLYLAEEQRYVFVDAREVAPAAATPEMYLDEQGEPMRGASLNGPLAAGIPGHVAGLAHLSKKYGRLELADCLAPAIRLASDGIPAYSRMLAGLRFRKKTAEQWPDFGKVFYRDGEPPEVGDIIRQPDLANSLKQIAKRGRDAFYRGKLAKAMVNGTRAAGGIWSLEDFENYRVVEREPLQAEFFGVKLVSAPPPSSGGVAIINIMNLVAGYDRATLDDVDEAHVLIEAMRRAYRDRALYLGDPDFVDVPVSLLTSPYYAAGQRTNIRLDRATASADLPGLWPAGAESNQTTHFSLIDADGNRVAATLTINGWYGAGFMPPGTGIILNNEMDDFAIAPGVPNGFNLLGTEANAVGPGRRPLSSMSPTFLESDRGVAILGTPGGSRIITMVLRAAMAWMDGATAQQMVELKRFHHQYYPDSVAYEQGALTEAQIAKLTERGHKLRASRRGFGNMNVVTWDFETGKVEAATDPRGKVEGRVY